MKHLLNKKIIFFVSLFLIINQAYAIDFKQSFEDLEKVFNNQLEDTVIEEEQDLINKIQNTSYLAHGETLENGVFLVHAPKKEAFSEKEKELFFDNKELLKEYQRRFKEVGSATAFRYKNYVVTNYHACRGHDVLLKDYTDKIVYAKVLGYNLIQDVCILSINNISKYQDFSAKKLEKLIESSKREVASNKVSPFVNTTASVFSMRGNFDVKNISKDNQKDTYTKINAFVSYNNKRECISGTSGSPVISQSGLIGIIWGASDSENPFEKKTACFFLDKMEIDKVISKIEQSI